MIKTKQELLNHFSDINAMYNNPFMYQTLSNMIDELLEQQPCKDWKFYYNHGYAQAKRDLLCEDCISRQEVLDMMQMRMSDKELYKAVYDLPSVTPKYTDEEIQKMQELEQAQLDKAYELGKQTSFEEWLASFNTESATCCFTAVQQLKEKLNGQMD